jgi:hypothetical protein
MVNEAQQLDVMEKVEALFDRYGGEKLLQLQGKLISMGFKQKGGDSAAVEMEHAELELQLDIGLDEEGNVHSYELLPFDEVKHKQEKFRW